MGTPFHSLVVLIIVPKRFDGYHGPGETHHPNSPKSRQVWDSYPPVNSRSYGKSTKFDDFAIQTWWAFPGRKLWQFTNPKPVLGCAPGAGSRPSKWWRRRWPVPPTWSTCRTRDGWRLRHGIGWAKMLFFPTFFFEIWKIYTVCFYSEIWFIYIYIYTTGGHKCEARNADFSGHQNQCRVMSVVARILLEKGLALEVPCQHTTSSQHVRACLIGLETTSNTARWVYRAIPCGLCHRIPVLPQWEALLCSKSRFYHDGSVPEIFLLENIILSPTDVSQEPCHSGAVSASSCSWLFLVSMFPLASKWHKLPPFLVGFRMIHLAWPEVQLCATIVAKS